MSFESTNMTTNFPFASAAQYALGNYVEIQEDATPPKIYEGGINTTRLATTLEVGLKADGENNSFTDITDGDVSSNSAVDVDDPYGYQNIVKIPNDPDGLDADELGRGSSIEVGSVRVIIALEGNMDVSEIRYLNYMQSNTGGSTRGVNNCNIYVLPFEWEPDTRYNRDTGHDPVFSGALNIAADRTTVQAIVLGAPVIGAYIVIDIVDNHGSAAYVGLRSMWPYGVVDTAVLADAESTVLKGDVHGNFVIPEKYPAVEILVSPDPKSKLMTTNFDEVIDGGAGTWISSGTGTVSSDATDYFNGTATVHIETATDATATEAKLTLGSSIDLTNYQTLRLSAKVEEGKKDAVDDVGGVVLKLDSAIGQRVIDISKYVKKLAEIGRFGLFDVSMKTGNGNDRAGNSIVDSGTFDITTVTDITIEAKGKAAQSSEIIFDQLFFFETELDKGVILFDWDDISDTLPDEIMPIHSKYGFSFSMGFVGSAFLSSVSGGWDSDSTWFKQALRYGCGISNHCMTGTGWIDSENTDAMIKEIFDAREILRQEGLSDNYVMIYPEGRFDGNRLAVAEKFFRSARTTQFDGPRTVQWPIAEPHIMNAFRLSSVNSLQDAKDAIDHCEAEKSIQKFYCHFLETPAGTLSWPAADVDALYAYAATKNVDIRSESKLMSGN